MIKRGSIDKLKVYEGLGIKEVWILEDGTFSVYSFVDRATGYSRLLTSDLLPGIDLSAIATVLNEPNQTQVVRYYRRSIKQSLRK